MDDLGLAPILGKLRTLSVHTSPTGTDDDQSRRHRGVLPQAAAHVLHLLGPKGRRRFPRLIEAPQREHPGRSMMSMARVL